MDDPTGRSERPLTLAQLIRSRMTEHGWSYTDLEQMSAHALSRGRWQQLGSGVQQKKFPDPASLKVIAAVLEIDVTTVVLAAAQTLGLNAHARGSDLANLLPPGTERLSEPIRDAILTLIRAAVSDAVMTGDEVDPTPPVNSPLEWPKSAAPSRRRHDGLLARGESDSQ